jgi:hypothetical protein
VDLQDWAAFSVPIFIAAGVAIAIFAVQSKWRGQDRAVLLLIARSQGVDLNSLLSQQASELEDRPTSRQLQTGFVRAPLRPWARWFSSALLVSFVAYAVYYGVYVFPTAALTTQPILTYLFFGLVVANGFWFTMLRIGDAVEDAEERQYILRELDRLRTEASVREDSQTN